MNIFSDQATNTFSINNPHRNSLNYNDNDQNILHNYYLLNNEELAKQAHIISKNQKGCRYLEEVITQNTYLVPTLFFPYILGYFEELSNHKFGNFYIKKLIK